MNSILTSVRRLSQVSSDSNTFDDELIAYINSTLLNLKQLGVGPKEGFVIENAEATWSEFIPDNKVLREATKTYLAAKVRLKFDPPVSGTAMEALKSIISEYEWRLNVEAETPC